MKPNVDPVEYCDVCGKTVEEDGEAYLLFPVDDRPEEPPLYVVRKCCLLSFEHGRAEHASPLWTLSTLASPAARMLLRLSAPLRARRSGPHPS